MVNGATRVVAIVGSPIAQVKSPDNFNAYFAHAGENVVMIPVDLAPEGLDDFVATVRQWKNLDGFVVTIPHKREIAARVDSLTDRAATLRAVNVVRRDADGALRGEIVDGLGFLAAALEHGFEPAGKHAFVIGAGGAGSAIAHALCEGGVSHLFLANVEASRLARLAKLLSARFPEVQVSTSSPDPEGLHLVVNATPLGMKAGDPPPLPPPTIERLLPSALVADVVTMPPVTPFLEAASTRGCKVQTGPEMARGQMELLGRFMGVIAEQ